jgi:hypothetical protein
MNNLRFAQKKMMSIRTFSVFAIFDQKKVDRWYYYYTTINTVDFTLQNHVFHTCFKIAGKKITNLVF